MSLYVLMGRAKSGKDSLADALARQIQPPRTLLRLAFANRLKEGTAVLLGPTSLSKDRQRPFLQAIGTACRKIDPMFWVRPIQEALRRAGTSAAVVTDCRYDNELVALLSEWREECHPIRVSAPEGQRRDRMERDCPGSWERYQAGMAQHPSETDLDWIDSSIGFAGCPNDGSLWTLDAYARAALSWGPNEGWEHQLAEVKARCR